jgi:hypothetical protein
LTKQRVPLKIGIILTVLVISFTLVAPSLTENARAANPSLTPTPTPTQSTSTLALVPTPEPTATPEPTYPLITTSQFAYSTIGKENSSLPNPKTVTLCNYTTPPDTGIIVQISIYLTGTLEGSYVRAVIFANEPETQLPQGDAPIAQSIDTLNVTSVSGEWYSFTMNYPASPNTVYWLGYYSDNFTHYFFDANNNYISLTSQPEPGNSTWIPVGWYYKGKSIMSLYALYTNADPPTPTPTPTLTPTPTPTSTLTPTPTPTSTPTPTPTSTLTPTPTPTLTPTPQLPTTLAQQGSAISTPAQSLPDTLFVLLIISGESAIMISARTTHQTREKKNASKQ